MPCGDELELGGRIPITASSFSNGDMTLIVMEGAELIRSHHPGRWRDAEGREETRTVSSAAEDPREATYCA